MSGRAGLLSLLLVLVVGTTTVAQSPSPSPVFREVDLAPCSTIATVGAALGGADEDLWYEACIVVLSGRGPTLPADPLAEPIVLTGKGGLDGEVCHALAGDYRVTVAAQREDLPACEMTVSFRKGRWSLGSIWNPPHGLGTSAAWDLDGEYVIDVRATKACGAWTVTISPLRYESE